jgi:hypothetical protein
MRHKSPFTGRLSYRNAEAERLRKFTCGLRPHVRREFGGRFVLVQAEKGRVYHLEPQEKLGAFAGQRVVIEGSLDQKKKSIHVVEIKSAQDNSH